MEATEKQSKILMANGYNEDQIKILNKQAISDAIGKIYSEKGWDSSKGNGKPSQSAPVSSVQTAQVNETIVRQISDTPHSYEFGKPGARHKVYYGTIEDLKKHIEALKEAGLIEEFEVIHVK